jgi:CHAT domain-containing protein/Tfp pilus assembly protein PilF
LDRNLRWALGWGISQLGFKLNYTMIRTRKFARGLVLSVVAVCHAAMPARWNNAFAQAGPTIRLDQGKELERTPTTQETDGYQIALLAGQFISVVVEQDGTDVAVSLFSPEEKEIASMDSFNGEYGPEPLVAIAESSGLYRVAVSSNNKGNLAGRYKIRIAELRSPAPGDMEHIAAERDIERAMSLAATGDGNDRNEAINRFRQALQYYEGAGAQDGYRHGLVLYSIGYLQAQKSLLHESIASYLAALPLFQAAGDPMMEARTRNNLGGEFHDLGEPLKALDYHREALSMLPPNRAGSLQAFVLNNMGVIFDEMGDWSAALEKYEDAASQFGTTGNWHRQAIAWRNIGYVYRTMNEPSQAMNYMDRALRLMQLKSVHDPTLQAEILTNEAEVLLSQGHAGKALELCQKALQLRRVGGDSRREGDTLSVMGSVYRALQKPEKAMEVFRQALAQQRDAGYQYGSFRTLLALGNLNLSQKNNREAQQELEEALNLALGLGCGECKVQAEFSLARLREQLGDSAESLRKMQSTVEAMEKLQAGSGSSILGASFLESHEPIYEFYIDRTLRYTGDAETASARAFQLSERARARAFLESLSGIQEHLEQRNDPELAERARSVRSRLAAASKESLGLSQNTQRGLKAGDAEDRIRQLEAEYNLIEAEKANKSRRYAALAQPRYLSVPQVQSLLDDQTLFLEYYLGEERSYLWAIARDNASVFELPAKKQIENACRLFYDAVRTHAKAGSSGNATTRAASDLSNLVLGPVANRLKDRRLVIAPDGALQSIPFSALNQPGITGMYQPLVLSHEIINVPSASAIVAQREILSRRAPADRTLAVFADPVFSSSDSRLSPRHTVEQARSVGRMPQRPDGHDALQGSDTRLLEHIKSAYLGGGIPRLPFTAIEADKILALVPIGTSLQAVGFDANRERAMRPDLSEYKYLHFATHGYVDSNHPELSALVLSMLDKSGDSEDGFLRLQDIYNLRLRADLVVLSACESGLGREIRGEGLVGLTRGFMYAGAARVLVSLWDVSDEGASALMPLFYKNMIEMGESPAAALRSAQIAAFRSKKWGNPYYWAPFTLQGEWK